MWNNRPVTPALVPSQYLFLWRALRDSGAAAGADCAGAAASGTGAVVARAGAGHGLGHAVPAGSALLHGRRRQPDGSHRDHPGAGRDAGMPAGASGGATALGSALVERCGPRGLPWALFGLGIVVGMPVFFEVGLVLLMPIVAAAARRSGRPPILVGIPLLAGLSIVHGTLPPHPAAMLAATQYHADLGRTILFGLVVGLPPAVLAGPVLGWVLRAAGCGRRQPAAGGAWRRGLPFAESLVPETPVSDRSRPDGPKSFLRRRARCARRSAILLPIALIFLGSWADALTSPGTELNQILHFIGSPDVALLIAVLVALVTLGPHIQTGRHHGRRAAAAAHQ